PPGGRPGPRGVRHQPGAGPGDVGAPAGAGPRPRRRPVRAGDGRLGFPRHDALPPEPGERGDGDGQPVLRRRGRDRPGAPLVRAARDVEVRGLDRVLADDPPGCGPRPPRADPGDLQPLRGPDGPPRPPPAGADTAGAVPGPRRVRGGAPARSALFRLLLSLGQPPVAAGAQLLPGPVLLLP